MPSFKYVINQRVGCFSLLFYLAIIQICYASTRILLLYCKVGNGTDSVSVRFIRNFDYWGGV